jgi:hypothetical protein
MISIIGNLVMGTFAWVLFWATISLGRRQPIRQEPWEGSLDVPRPKR